MPQHVYVTQFPSTPTIPVYRALQQAVAALQGGELLGYSKLRDLLKDGDNGPVLIGKTDDALVVEAVEDAAGDLFTVEVVPEETAAEWLAAARGQTSNPSDPHVISYEAAQVAVLLLAVAEGNGIMAAAAAQTLARTKPGDPDYPAAKQLIVGTLGGAENL